MDTTKAHKRFSQKYLNSATMNGTHVHKLKSGNRLDFRTMWKYFFYAVGICIVYFAGYKSALSNQDSGMKDPRIELEQLGLSSPVRESMGLGAIQKAQGFSDAYPIYQNEKAEIKANAEIATEEDENTADDNEETPTQEAIVEKEEEEEKTSSSEGLSLDELLVDYKEFMAAPLINVPGPKLGSKKSWWALKTYEREYTMRPIPKYVPRIDPKVQLTMEDFHEKFRKQGHPLIFSFDNLRSLGFKTKHYTLNELKQMFPFDAKSTPSKVQQEFVANGIRRDEEELDLGPALVAIERDETLAKQGKLRNFPRNLKVKAAAIQKLQIEKPPLVPDMDQFQLPTVWMGTSTSDTRFHHDCCDNFVMMIMGTKRFTLAPTSDWRTLKPTCVGANKALCWANVPHPNSPEKLTPKFERIMSKVNKIVVDIKPGEILYMPAGWFHHIENLGPTVMVNWWTKSSETIALMRAKKDPSY